MNFIFETAINAIEAFLILEFLSRYFTFRVSGSLRYIGFGIAWLISTVSITFFSWNVTAESYSGFVQIIINILFCVCLLEGSIGSKVFLSAFTMGGVILITSFTTFFIGDMHQYRVQDILTQFSSVRVIAIFVSKILFFQVTRIILRMKENTKISTQDIFPLVVVPIISIGTIWILTHAAIENFEIQRSIFYAVCMIIILNFLTYYMFLRMNRNSQIKRDYELLNMQYDCVKQNAADIQNMYENIRSMRHDMTNHLLCILNLLKESPDNKESVCSYIQGLLKHQEDSCREVIFSSNDALDAIINIKQVTAHQYGIKFDIIIADSLHFMLAEDICVLFGNLLDNAISAAKKTEEKKVSLNIQPQDMYVSIVLSNSIHTPILMENPDLKTTKVKKDGHGYGVKNIKKVVQQYHGMIRFYEDKEQFTSDILLLTIPVLE